MKYFFLAILMAAVAAFAGPVNCGQVEKYVYKNIPGCRCILADFGVMADSVSRRNIVQYCPSDGGHYLSSIQMKIPSSKWVAYELMDCAVLEEDNVSCKSVKTMEEDKEPKFVSSKKYEFMLFLYSTYGVEDVNYLRGAER